MNSEAQIKILFALFCEELVIMMERLRLLYLVCHGSQFLDEELTEWGHHTIAWRAMHELAQDILPPRPIINVAIVHTEVQDLQDNILRLQVFDPSNYNVIQKTDNFTSLSPNIIDNVLGSDFKTSNNLDTVIVAHYGLEELQKQTKTSQLPPNPPDVVQINSMDTQPPQPESPSIVQINSLDTADTNLPMAEPVTDETNAHTGEAAGETM